jgi:ligand-binding sensor domain-containing protein
MSGCLRASFLVASLAAVPIGTAASQGAVPALPDSGGWGVHVLAAARDPSGALWLGTYGKGIYRLSPGATTWQVIRSDTTPGALSWDFVQAFGFGPRGQIWYGTVGNGWGVSLDGGKTWKSWTYGQLVRNGNTWRRGGSRRRATRR